MKLKKLSTGEYFTLKEFFHQWKEGMKNITPLQQTQTNQIGFIIVFIGIIWGIIFAFKTATYWVVVMLVGSSIVVGNAFITNWQKKEILKEIENMERKNNKLNKLLLVSFVIQVIILLIIIICLDEGLLMIGWLICFLGFLIPTLFKKREVKMEGEEKTEESEEESEE